MSFEDTTRRMADEVAQLAHGALKDATEWDTAEGHLEKIAEVARSVRNLARAVEMLARCVARRFDHCNPGGACNCTNGCASTTCDNL